MWLDLGPVLSIDRLTLAGINSELQLRVNVQCASQRRGHVRTLYEGMRFVLRPRNASMARAASRLSG